jgi:flagellar basal-body rod protein FlgC
MGMFTSINIASSGLTAERLRTDVIANNIANATTTRTPEGGPFRRSEVIMATRVDKPYWNSPFLLAGLDNGVGDGVRVAQITKDSAPPILKWDPTHPDAIKSGPRAGYVEMPNISVVTEMTNLIDAQRAYEANAQIVEAAKGMFNAASQISFRV